jgi:uncharacterized membrane protein
MRTTRPSSVFLALVSFAAVQGIYYHRHLPPLLGSHFLRDGGANAWASHAQFFTVELVVIGVAALVAFGIPRIISLFPPQLINLPHKDYWLAPERREQTLAYLQSQMAWFGCVFLAFLLFAMELVFRANLRTPPQLNSAALVCALLAFVLCAAFLLIRMIQHIFRKPFP